MNINFDLLCVTDILTELRVWGDIKLILLPVVVTLLLTAAMVLGVTDARECDPPRLSRKLLNMSRYCFCKDKQQFKRAMKLSSLVPAMSFAPFFLDLIFTEITGPMELACTSSSTLVQSLSSSPTMVLPLR